MRAYARGRGCLMEFLQQALDDPDPGPCGRCSVCTGELPAPGRELDPADVEAVRIFLRGADTVLEPRKRWPGGVAGGARARSSARARPGAHLRRHARVGRGHHGARRGATRRCPTRWSTAWSRCSPGGGQLGGPAGRGRAHAVAPVPGAGPRPGRTDRRDRQAPARRRAHRQRSAAAGRHRRPSRGSSTCWPASSVDRPDVELPADGPVLLVDDTYRTGWTMTVAAALLRDAGASAVLPLVVHQLP